jgi:TetR/AcrR family transcriptional regulator, cholesterol catabolism regulator
MSMARPTGPRNPNRRDEILRIAAETFSERGYAATSIKDIADRAGMLKGSLYHHIDSKEQLLFEIIQTFHDDGMDKIIPLFGSDAPAIDVVREVVRRHVLHNVDNYVEAGVFHREFRSLSEELRQLVVKGRDPYETRLRALIRRGQREGMMRANIDGKLASMAILNSVNSIYTWYRPGGRNTGEQIADAYADFVVAGLVNDPRPGRPRKTAVKRKPPARLARQDAAVDG